MSQDNLDKRLDRLKQFIAGEPKSPATSSAPDKPAVPARYTRLAQALEGEVRTDLSGCYCVVRRLYPFDSPFGSITLTAPKANHLPLAHYEAQAVAGEMDISKAVFFDTETTGLGGVGAVPFLIGCGSLTEEGFEVRQYVLPDYADEAAMLERVMTEFGADRALVSYNGRAFDAPLVRDRMIVNRVAREIPYVHHVDLLHAARRLFKRRLHDCTLTNIEREIFGFHREDDIPGYLIPSVYFDWLAGDEIGDLPAVLEHNRLDIVSLYVLLLKVGEIFRSEGADLESVDDLYSLSRVYERRKERTRVVNIYRRIDSQSEMAPESDVLWFHSLAFKREGDWSEAVAIWEQLAEGDSGEALRAEIELAKYYEHRVKDAASALEYAQRAARRTQSVGRFRDDLMVRMRRLRTKLD